VVFADDSSPETSPRNGPPKPRIAQMQPPGGSATFHLGW
jgi:hypothetical protein